MPTPPEHPQHLGDPDEPDDDSVVDPALLSIAERIAEGTTVVPAAEETAAPPGTDRDVLKALLDIAAIESAHRQAEASFEQVWTGTFHVPRQWGPLTILEPIGRGEFGDVYRAHHHGLNQDVALKLAPATTDAEADRLLDEARRLARVRHTNVVRIHDVEHRNGQVGFWMDLIEGQTLEQLTQVQGFSAEDAAQAGIALSRALAAVHQQGVLHGDIKAQNVIRSSGSASPGRILLIDFGAGRELSDAPPAGSDTIGTPVYMAPEVLAGNPRSTASDIYSLGILLFHLVTRQFPIYATTKAGFLDAHAKGAGKCLRDLRPDLPQGFVGIVERATAHSPEARYPSCGAIESALLAFLTRPHPIPLPAVPDPPAPAPSRWIWRGIGIAALLALAVGLAWRGGGNPGAAPAAAAESRAMDRELPIDGYTIDAAFYRTPPDSREDERLTRDSQVMVNDHLHASITTSTPVYLYVVNEDERGRSFLLFPLREKQSANFLEANRSLRIPEDWDWVVNSAGGKEHFILFASSTPVPALDQALSRLPSPQEPLPADLAVRVRGVGRVEPVPARPGGSHFSDLFTDPLLDRKETARGLWARQLTVGSVAR